MESPQDSWPDEFLSSAEYTFSPPISPAPQSPTLYSFGSSSVNNVNKLGVDLSEFKTTITLPNDSVECIPLDAFNEVHQQHMDMPVSPFICGSSGESLLTNAMDMPILSSIQAKDVQQISPRSLQTTGEMKSNFSFPCGMNDLYESNDELSGNLEELFEDLVDAHVRLDDEYQPESPLEQQLEPSNWSDAMQKLVATNNLIVEQNQPNTLGDDFHQILQDLGLTMDISNISHIPGVQVIFANELDALANEGEDLGLISGDDNMMDTDDDQSTTSSIGNDSPHSSFGEVVIISDENETKLDLFMNDVSNSSNLLYFSNPSTASNSDDEDDAQEKILDALTRGDIRTAKSLVNPSSSTRHRDIKNKSSVIDNGTQGSSALVTQKLALLKPEKRGRKPSSAAAGKAWVHLTDKGLRKKEQNKTAATRYRQKKKMETLYSLEKEQELTRENEQLNNEKNDLNRQIRMVKEILRELFSAKKNGQQQVGKRH